MTSILTPFQLFHLPNVIFGFHPLIYLIALLAATERITNKLPTSDNTTIKATVST